MEDLELISFTDPLLKKAPADFNFEENDAKDISEKLHVAMVKTGGIGISANQVGLDMKVFVINKIDDMPGKTFLIQN
jgi:peptide deformylase